MAFTEAEKVQVRKYCGYGLFGSTPIQNFAWRYSTQYGAMEFILNNMSADEETEVKTNYLVKLPLLEEDLFNVRDNSDTSQAAVWYRNKKELQERQSNYDYWRNRLCDFMNIQAGPDLEKMGRIRICP